MNMFLPLVLLASAPAQVDDPRSFLVSIVDVPLEPGESIQSFTLATWGVTFNSVCRIPPGWMLTVGGGLTPEGVLEGEGSHGAAWFRDRSPAALQAIANVTLSGPVQADAARIPDTGGELPATFAGSAVIGTGEGEREIALTASNVHLTPADRCPE